VPPVALTRKQTKFIAVKESIPIKLRAVANDICNFFNNHKGGQKTKTAFDGLINNLIRILDDPHGGIQDVKAQLKEAIQRSVDGEKKWHSITYSNWERFGKKQRPAWDVANTRASTATLMQVFEEDEAAVLSL
jgi:hypothetical protein